MEMVHDAGKIAFMSFDQEHHRIALVETPVEAEPASRRGRARSRRLRLRHARRSALDLHSPRRRMGIEPFWPINHGPSTSLYYKDPGGNGVELFVDNYATAAELNGWIKSEAFEANPIGVSFDPKKLIERYEAGDAIEELVKQGSA